MLRTQIASGLVGVAVALAVVCSTGVAIMEDALQRLHFSAAVTSFSTGLIVAAVWLDDPNWQARLKALLIAIVLFVMNSVLSHSTARAIRVRESKQLHPEFDVDLDSKLGPLSRS
jgi:multisubunit Na+/H+ antiporter MnhG subunit